MRHIGVTSTLAARILAIAREAGAAIMKIYEEIPNSAKCAQEALVVEKKDDGSPLTRADLEAHWVISTRLACLVPGVRVVSEEDVQSLEFRLPTGDFWLIDALDGTKEFLARNGEYTVNIALVRDGKSVFGVVVAPALGQAYWGGDHLGAFREMGGGVEPIHVANSAAADRPVRVIASKSHMNLETIEFIKKLGKCELVQFGSSLKFCRLAEGAADVYPRLGPTCEWDTAAAQAILEAAGGQVVDLNGAPLRYGKPNVLNPHFVASIAPLPDTLVP